MKVIKVAKLILVFIVLLANLVFAPACLADAPKISKNPDYIALKKELNQLQKAKEKQSEIEGLTTEQIKQKINELEFQKYALESGITWGQCRNETGRTLAVYGSEPNLDEDEYSSNAVLYFLANNQTTQDNWDCKGVYLPSDINAVAISPDGQNQELSGGTVVKVPNGTKVVLKSNSDTGAVEFSTTGVKILKPGELNWYVPNVSQAVVDTRVTNAPVKEG